MKRLLPVILAGGSGTRLWPLSRRALPKQLTALVGKKTLIQDTVGRLETRFAPEDIRIAVAQEYLAETQKQLPQIRGKNYIVEPFARNTAPAIGLVATVIALQDPQAIVATLPSDHLVERTDEFLNVLETARVVIEKHPQYLMTIGLTPTEPNTGLGYIQKARLFELENGRAVYHVAAFHEKPDVQTASAYVKSGNYFWNANYLVWNPQHMLKLFATHQPRMAAGLKKISTLLKDRSPAEKIKAIFEQFPAEPIDTAINEKAKDILVIPADLGWNDIGSWETLHTVLKEKTKKSVVVRGDHIGIGDEDVLVHSQNKLVATVGLKDIIIVDTPDVTLVADKRRSQDVKKLIEILREQGKEMYL